MASRKVVRHLEVYPAANTSAFLSLVLPRFALGRIHEEEMWLAEIGEDGRWRRVVPSERIEGVPR